MSKGSNNIAFANRASSSAGSQPGGNALDVEFVAAWQTHHLAYTVNIFFETDDTLDLASHILLPFGREAT